MKNSLRTGFTALLIILFSYGCFRKESYSIKMTITPEQIINSLTPNDLEDASSIIRNRMIAFGIKDENINCEVSTDKIILSLTGIDTGKVETIKEIITTTVDIGFWETYDNSEVITYLINANSKSKELNLGEEFRPYRKPAADSADKDELLLHMVDSSSITAREEFNLENPVFAILYPRVDETGTALPSCLIGLSDVEDTLKVMQLLSRDEIRNLFPRNLKFLWSRDPYRYDKSGRLYELHAIKVNTYDDRPVLDGEVIPEVEVISDRGGINVRLRLMMTREGAAKWSAITRNNIDRFIAVSLDDKIITYPRVMNEITGGNTEITGNFTLPEAQYLAAVLSSGGMLMPFKLKIIDLQMEKTK
jgi:SecD/SecF fusion protein